MNSFISELEIADHKIRRFPDILRPSLKAFFPQ